MNYQGRSNCGAFYTVLFALGCSAVVNAQLSVDVSGSAFDWSIGGHGDDAYADGLVRHPGPAWAAGLNVVDRPDSSWVGLAFGLRYERREFDVDFASGGLGAGLYGEEYVRLGSLYIQAGLNFKLHPNGRWWAKPSLAVLCFNEGFSSGWSRSWSMGGYSTYAEYSDKYTRDYGAPIFMAFELEHLHPLGPRWFMAYRVFAAQSFSLRPNYMPFGRLQYQLGAGIGIGLRLGEGLLLALKRDREARMGKP